MLYLKNKGIIMVIICIYCGLLLTGCSLRKNIGEIPELSAAQEEQIPDTVSNAWVKFGEVNDLNWDEILSVFLGLSEDEAERYKCPEYGYYYEIGLQSLTGSGGDTGNIQGASPIMLNYIDDRDGAADCYMTMLQAYSIQTNFLQTELQWRKFYPEENLDFCTKEAAIEACRPYIETIGYDDARVTVFAITFEAIQEALKRQNWLSMSAPGPGYDKISTSELKEVEALLKEGKSFEQAYEILGISVEKATEREIPWTEKDEAFLLVYQPYVDGVLIESSNSIAIAIYVPQYGRPVYIQALLPPVVDMVIAESKLISKKDAIKELMLSYWIKSTEEIEIEDMYLTSGITMVKDQEKKDGWKYQMIPAWKIDFQLKGRNGAGIKSILIDALRGNILE